MQSSPTQPELSPLQSFLGRLTANENLRRLNRELRMLNECNQTLVRATDEISLLNEVCRIAVEIGGYRLAWVGFSNEDKEKSVRMIARGGEGSENLEDWPVTWADALHGHGTSGTAIRTGKVEICRDIRTDPRSEPWRARADALGLASGISLPLHGEGRVVGVLTIYSNALGCFDDAEVRLLEGLAGDLAYGIAALRARAAHAAAEASLREKVTVLEALLNATPDGVVVVDEHNRKIIQNQRIIDLLKIPREVADDPDDGRQVETVMRRLKDPANATAAIAHLKAHAEEVSRAEAELIDGTALDIFSAPVTGRDGRHYGRIFSFRDITGRVRAEEIRDNLARIVDSSEDAIFSCLLDGTVLSWNRASERIFGYTAAEMIGKSLLLIIPPDRAGELAQISGKIGRGEHIGRFESVARRKDGTPVDVAATISPLRNSAGETIGTSSIAHDTTAQRRMARDLAENQRRLQAILDHSPAAIYMKDLTGRYLLTNRLFDRMCLPAGGSAAGKTVQEFLAREAAAPYEAHDAAVIAEGRPIMREYFEARPEGGRYQLEVKFPLRDEAGKIVALGGISTDITERKNLEAQFLQAQKMEAFGQLAGGIAHDFNNVLATMLMRVSLMSDEPRLTPSMQSSLGELEASARRASALVRQLLVFSRRGTLELRTVNLDQALAEVTAMLRQFLGEQIRLELEHGDVAPWIEADPGMIQQIVMNLCVNARDAMPRGGRLTLRTEVVDRGGGSDGATARAGRYVSLAVADTGCGMDEATRTRIFEPFFTTKEVGKGTGLGLATVYGIVKQHRGWIEVESSVGRGSTFRIFFHHAPPPVRAPSAAAPAERRGGSETILLVEDEEAVREVTAIYLRRMGYQVIEAVDAVDAAGRWNDLRDRVDLLLTDMVMPRGMSGLDLIEKLRRTKASLKTIIVSGYNLDAAKTAAAARDGVIYLGKPVDSRILADTIRRCLDGR